MGVLIAAGLLIGGGIGIARGEPSLGVIIGFAAGIALSALWVLVKRRS